MELTSRQRQILQLLVNGKSEGQIAAILQISKKTVGKHLVVTRRKYGVATRAEMIARAVARGDVYVFMGEVQIQDGWIDATPSLALFALA